MGLSRAARMSDRAEGHSEYQGLKTNDTWIDSYNVAYSIAVRSSVDVIMW